MTTTKRFGASVLLAAVVAIFVLGTTTSVRAQEAVPTSIDQVGWWSSRPGATPAADGGFEVGTGPDGTVQSVAAFQVTIGAGRVDTADLILSETAALVEFGSLAVCRTADGWAPANPGALDDAPKPDCSTKINLTRTTDSRVWIGDVATLVSQGGAASLMIVPEYAPPTPVGAGMVVSIGSIELTATGSTPPTTTTTLDFTTPGGSNTFDSNPDSALGDFTPSPDAGTSDFSFGGAPPIDDLGLGASEPDLAPPPDEIISEPAAAIDDDTFFTLGPLEERPGETRPWVRLVAIVPLSAGIAFSAVWLRRRLLERALTGGYSAPA